MNSLCLKPVYCQFLYAHMRMFSRLLFRGPTSIHYWFGVGWGFVERAWRCDCEKWKIGRVIWLNVTRKNTSRYVPSRTFEIIQTSGVNAIRLMCVLESISSTHATLHESAMLERNKKKLCSKENIVLYVLLFHTLWNHK